MKKYWWAAWLLCLAIGILLFVATAMAEAASGPSADWSRKLELQTVTGLSAYAGGGQRYLTVVSTPGKVGGDLLVANGGLVIQSFGLEGEAMSPIQVQLQDNTDFPDPDRFFGRWENYEGGQRMLVTALAKGEITHYAISDRQGKPVLSELTREKTQGIQDFVMAGPHVLYRDTEGFGLIGGKYRKVPVENMVFLDDSGKQLAVIRSLGSARVLEAYNSNDLENPFRTYRLNSGARVVYENLTAYSAKIGQGVFVEMRDSGNATSLLMQYGFTGKQASAELAHGSHIMQPLAHVRQDGRVVVLSTQMQKKGNQMLANIQSGIFDGHRLQQERFLTRSDQGNLAVAYLDAAGVEGLVSVERTHDGENISLSGSHQGLIQTAGYLSGKDVKEVLFNCMLTLPMAIFSGLVPFLYIVFPTAVLLGIVSCFKMNVVEYHFKKAVILAIGLHLLIKVYYSYTSIMMNPSLPSLTKVMPAYLNTPLAALLTLTCSTLAALWITCARYGEWRQGDYFGIYMTFAVIDLSIFTCLVMPYYASYLTLPIFY